MILTVLQFFVLHSNYSALVHSKLQHNTVIVKSQGKAISIYYNCNSIHVYRYQLKWYSIFFLRLQDWNWLICYKLFLSNHILLWFFLWGFWESTLMCDSVHMVMTWFSSRLRTTWLMGLSCVWGTCIVSCTARVRGHESITLDPTKKLR